MSKELYCIANKQGVCVVASAAESSEACLKHYAHEIHTSRCIMAGVTNGKEPDPFSMEWANNLWVELTKDGYAIQKYIPADDIKSKLLEVLGNYDITIGDTRDIMKALDL